MECVQSVYDHFRTRYKISIYFYNFKLKVTRENTTLSSNTNAVPRPFITRYRNTCPAAAAREITAALWKAANLHTAHAATLQLLTTAGKLRAHSNKSQTQALMTGLITFPTISLLHNLYSNSSICVNCKKKGVISDTSLTLHLQRACVYYGKRHGREILHCCRYAAEEGDLTLIKPTQRYNTNHKEKLDLLTILRFGLLCQHCRNQVSVLKAKRNAELELKNFQTLLQNE